MKNKILAISLGIAAVVSGCNSEIDMVKNGTLQGYEQTTVGKAVESVFGDVEWTYFETEKGVRVVEAKGWPGKQMFEFGGILYERYGSYSFELEPYCVEPQKMVIQFTLHTNSNLFDVSYCSLEKDMISRNYCNAIINYRQPLKITPKRLFTNKLTFTIFSLVTKRGFCMDQLSFFDLNDRLAQISKIGDPLEVLNEIVDWSKFDGVLLKAKAKDLTDRRVKGHAGRKPFSLRLMLKVFVLQSLYNLSDDQMEYQIKDRLSFMRFLDLGLNGTVPDAKTIWNYREMFVRTGVWEKLFREFDGMLEEKGLFARGGSIVDATIVNVPVQRNKADENETIKKGKEPEAWKEQPAKSAQKDVDARWGCKHGTYTFGYKAHVVADNKNKIVRNVIVTAASVHDSNVYGQLLDGDRNTSKDVWADSGYVGSSDPLPEGYREHVCKKGFREKPLTAFQTKCNARKSRTRCRIEHVFGWVKGNHELFVRTIGKARAEAKILASFLTYNMFRMAALTRPKWA